MFGDRCWDLDDPGKRVSLDPTARKHSDRVWGRHGAAQFVKKELSPLLWLSERKALFLYFSFFANITHARLKENLLNQDNYKKIYILFDLGIIFKICDYLITRKLLKKISSV